MKLKKIFTTLASVLCAAAFMGFAACSPVGGGEGNGGGDPTPLKAPEITINQETGVINWEPIDHADGYNIYVDNSDVFSDQTDTNSYNILESFIMPGAHSFQVTATSMDEKYSESPKSNSDSYTVEFVATVNVKYPAGYTGTITLEFYKDETKAEGKDKQVTIAASDTSPLSVEVKGLEYDTEYTIKATGVASGYVAGVGVLNAGWSEADITIYSTNGALALNDENTVNIAESYTPVEKIFVATTGGAYTVSVVGEYECPVDVSVGEGWNAATLFSTAEGKTMGKFTAKAGEVVTLGFTAFEAWDDTLGDGGAYKPFTAFDFKFTIVEGDLTGSDGPIDFKVGTGYGDQENVFSGDCTGTLNIETAGKYTFQIPSRIVPVGVSITIKIDGTDYVFDGDNGFYMNIDLTTGEKAIEITIDGEVNGELTLFIFPYVEEVD